VYADAPPSREPRAERRWGWRRTRGEPLVLFLALGLLVFAAERAERSAKEGRRVHLAAAEVTRLVRAFEGQAGRPPDEVELEMLVAERVREEVLYREALRLGLDQGDVIVRRRLAQKMGFVLADRREVAEPTVAEVRGFFAANADRYTEPARISFQHVFLSSERRGAAAAVEEARVALAALRSRAQGEDGGWRRMGDPFMLPREYGGRALPEIAELFGAGFAEQLVAAPLDRWSGPVASPYGTHLVRVVARFAEAQPELDEVRDRVLEDLREARREQADEAMLEQLLRRYRVTVSEAPGAPWPAPDERSARVASAVAGE
jgi:parvulin-like peptidyl-prolyl isomerase